MENVMRELKRSQPGCFTMPRITILMLVVIIFLSMMLASCKIGDSVGPGGSSPHIYHIGEIDTPGFAYAVAISENDIYLADGVGGLRIINVTSPHFPQHKNYYEDEGIYYDVKYNGGDYVYVAAGEAGFKIIDVKSPFGPELIGEISTHNAFGLDYAGQYVYLADEMFGVRIFDVSNPFNIYELSNLLVQGQRVNNVTVDWPFLYVASRYGFSIVNIENPIAPTELFYENAPNHVYDIEVIDHRAYLAYEGGLRIYYVYDPYDPELLGFVHLPSTARSVVVRGDFAYVTVGRNGLSIINVSDPQQPYEIAYYNPAAGEMSDAVLQGRYIYLANGETGLTILEFWPGY